MPKTTLKRVLERKKEENGNPPSQRREMLQIEKKKTPRNAYRAIIAPPKTLLRTPLPLGILALDSLAIACSGVIS